jgi:hypothetical protein
LLQDLVARNLLKSTGAGRGTAYVPGPSLQAFSQSDKGRTDIERLSSASEAQIERKAGENNRRFGQETQAKMTRISQQQLESYLWGAAVLLRGTIDAGDYKQFIFPLLFYKRLCVSAQ